MSNKLADQNPLKQQGDSINPYKLAAVQLLSRLLWDLNAKSWNSRAKLNRYRSTYSGKKCVILCNGPSLLNTDFDLLERSKIATFGLNKINLLFEKVSFRPTFIAAVNQFVIEQNADFFNKTEIPLFLSYYGRRLIKSRKNVSFLHTTASDRFARNCSISIGIGGTVTYVAMQLAFHMGFRQVALVGCDHSFATKGVSNMAVKSEGKDLNHFDPNYFSGGNVWQLPDLPRSEMSYSLAGAVFDAFGGGIVNCTDGGNLELFHRATLSEFIEG